MILSLLVNGQLPIEWAGQSLRQPTNPDRTTVHLTDVHHLLDHVQLAQAAMLFHLGRQGVELLAMLQAHILHVTQPVVHQPMAFVPEGR
jgi:hypothetical protein